MVWPLQVTLLSLLFVVCGSTDLPGPCREWLNPCGAGDWRCTSVQTYKQFLRGPQPFCPSVDTTPPPVPAVYCSIVNGVCHFTNTTVNCTSWFNLCHTQFGCGTTEQALSQSLCLLSNLSGPQLQSKDLCVPINESCEWYNPCRMWPGWCQQPYHCGTVDEYYQFLYGPQPLCARPPPDWVEPTPPGECIAQNGQCTWSNCTAWLNWCHTGWQCGTQLEEAVYRTGPIPPCAPRDDDSLPTLPGECVFDLYLETCRFADECSSGKVYTSCGSACPLTCANYLSPPACTQHCVAGCFCPEGTVEYDGGCVDTDHCPGPCSLIFCAPNSNCRVSSSGEAQCVVNCEGGCREDQICVYTEFLLHGEIVHGYSTVCVDTPNVPCSSGTVTPQLCDGNGERCLVQNKTKESFCVQSCFQNNGGCDSDEVCYTEVDEYHNKRLDHDQCTTHVECEELEDIGDDRCPPGWVYSDCGTACEATCETHLNATLLFRSCITLCVEGCFCELGLVRYRDRCVDPRECYVLVNDPPPINPLPVRSGVVLISMISPFSSLNDFKLLEDLFVNAARTLILNVTLDGIVKVQLHGYYHGEGGLQIVIEVSGTGYDSAQIMSQLRANANQLPLQIESIYIVETQSISSGHSPSDSTITGIVIGVVVFLLAVVVVITALLIIIVFLRRNSQNKVSTTAKADALVTYAKLDYDNVTGEEVKLPLEENKEKMDVE